MITIAFVVLVTLAIGALAYGVMEPRLQLEKTARNRLGHFQQNETDAVSKRVARDRLNEVAKRRKTIQNSLDDIDSKQKARNQKARDASLDRRLAQAGLSISPRQFVLFSLGAGFFAFLFSLVLGMSALIALGIGFAVGFGLPRWVLSFLRKRRQNRFSEEFANAVDVIVRGIRSGLPLNDTLRMIATETAEPVRSEFARVVEALQLGLPMTEAVERLYQNMPLAETNFFAIVVSIQSQAGGNLGEALSNLSRVLRDRKKMKGKIQAMSMEAKASGAIIGALPFIVGFLVFLTSPEYIMILFTTSIGNIVLACSAFWMSIGILVMRNMINFDF